MKTIIDQAQRKTRNRVEDEFVHQFDDLFLHSIRVYISDCGVHIKLNNRIRGRTTTILWRSLEHV